jgi:hydroxymethylbilane synthase
MTAAPAATLRIATRRSVLARTQSEAVGRQLAALTGQPVELVEVVTTGDVDPSPLAQMGGTGVFVTAVRQALVDGRADVAVHSLKDLPTAPDPRLELAAVPPREDPRDALVARDRMTLADLPAGARVGTGSPRRRALLQAARPDLRIVDIRGNVDSRLSRVLGADAASQQPRLDAVVLAVAGLARLGRTEVICEHLDPDVIVPAPGQGALAIEARAGSDLAIALRALDDPGARAAVTAERSVLATLEAGCSAPVGALGAVTPGAEDSPTLRVQAVLAGPDGALLRRWAAGPAAAAQALGRDLAADLLADGGLGSGPAPAMTPTTTASQTIDRGSSIR